MKGLLKKWVAQLTGSRDAQSKRGNRPVKPRLLRLESLESRELLSATWVATQTGGSAQTFTNFTDAWNHAFDGSAGGTINLTNADGNVSDSLSTTKNNIGNNKTISVTNSSGYACSLLLNTTVILKSYASLSFDGFQLSTGNQITNDGTLTLTNSYLKSFNVKSTSGVQTLNMNYCTVSSAKKIEQATVNANNSIIACSVTATTKSGTHNLTDDTAFWGSEKIDGFSYTENKAFFDSNYHLLAGNEAINAGGTYARSKDAYGQAGKLGAHTDIGAFEYQLTVDESVAGYSLKSLVEDSAQDKDTIYIDVAGVSVTEEILVSGKSITIEDQTDDGTTITGANTRIFYVADGGALALQGKTVNEDVVYMTITGGNGVSAEGEERYSGSGGAIFVDGGGTLTTADVKFANNGAEKGGAVAVKSNANATFVSTYFKENTAAHGKVGGAIYSQGTVEIKGSSFDTNSVKYEDGDTAGDGGAVYNASAGILSIYDSAFEGNTAYSSGGAVTNWGTLTIKDKYLPDQETTESSTFTKNKAGNGGAIANGGTLTANSIYATENEAEYGGVLINGASGASSTLTDASCETNTATGNGGALSCSAGTLTINGGEFTYNTADNGGALVNAGVTVIAMNGEEAATFSNNTADYNGGAINNLLASGDDLNLEIKGAKFSDNTAGSTTFKGSGGAIMNWGNALLDSCDIDKGTASFGGGIANVNALTLAGTTSVTNCEATQNGGGIANFTGTYGTQKMTGKLSILSGITVSNNKAAQYGGGILSPDDSMIVFTGATAALTMSGNTAKTGKYGKDIAWQNMTVYGKTAEDFKSYDTFDIDKVTFEEAMPSALAGYDESLFPIGF